MAPVVLSRRAALLGCLLGMLPSVSALSPLRSKSGILQQDIHYNYEKMVTGHYCHDSDFIFEGQKDDCQEACDELDNCHFFTNYSANYYHEGWCQLSDLCNLEPHSRDPTAVTYKKTTVTYKETTTSPAEATSTTLATTSTTVKATTTTLNPLSVLAIEWFDKADVNHSGKVGWAEFLAQITLEAPRGTVVEEGMCKEVFYLAAGKLSDGTQSTIIYADELVTFMNSDNGGEDWASPCYGTTSTTTTTTTTTTMTTTTTTTTTSPLNKLAIEWFAEVDTNNSGKIGWAEYKAAIEKELPSGKSVDWDKCEDIFHSAAGLTDSGAQSTIITEDEMITFMNGKDGGEDWSAPCYVGTSSSQESTCYVGTSSSQESTRL